MSTSSILPLLRSALSDLGDLEQLARSVLCQRINAKHAMGEMAQADLSCASRLREILIRAIESLKPSDDKETSSSEWRQYTILYDRYVLRRPLWQVEQKLHLGERQVRREHRRALALLAVRVEAEIAQYVSTQVAATEAHSVQLPTLALSSKDYEETDMIRAAQNLTPEPSVFGVAELFEDLQAILQELMRHSGKVHTISWVVRPLDLSIYADRGILHQLLLKLLQVLLERTRPGMSTLSVSAQLGEGNRVQLTVQRYLDAVITDAATLAQSEIHPLCVGLARALQASLQCCVDAAGLFTLTLALPAGTRLRKVLIVDDEPASADLLCSYLTGQDYRIVALTRALNVLERARDWQPDAIVLDVMMPAMDGWELLQRLRHDPIVQNVPIVVCSILPDAELALALGAAACLRKPVLRQQLLATLEKVLSARGVT